MTYEINYLGKTYHISLDENTFQDDDLDQLLFNIVRYEYAKETGKLSIEEV